MQDSTQADLHFEDDFEDEFQEEVVVDNQADWEDVPEETTEDRDEEMKDEEEKAQTETYLGGPQVPEGQELVYENSAYEMIHRATCEWPALSIDWLLDDRMRGQTSDTWFPYINQLNPDTTIKKEFASTSGTV